MRNDVAEAKSDRDLPISRVGKLILSVLTFPEIIFMQGSCTIDAKKHSNFKILIRL